jgi:hypothetical protein
MMQEINMKSLLSLMVLLAARSKMSLVFVVAVLVMALVMTLSVSAGVDDGHCVQWPPCNTNGCGGMCAAMGINGNGICKVVNLRLQLLLHIGSNQSAVDVQCELIVH